MCVEMSEMSKITSLKMGEKFATSLKMGEIFPQKLYIMICKNSISGHISHRIH